MIKIFRLQLHTSESFFSYFIFRRHLKMFLTPKFITLKNIIYNSYINSKKKRGIYEIFFNWLPTPVTKNPPTAPHLQTTDSSTPLHLTLKLPILRLRLHLTLKLSTLRLRHHNPGIKSPC